MNETHYSVREYCLEVHEETREVDFNETKDHDWELMVCHEHDLSKIYKLTFLIGNFDVKP